MMAHFPKQLFVRRERPIGGSDEEYFTAPASARVKFWRGDRVRLTKEAVARGVERSQRTGVVVGFGHVGHKVRVVPWTAADERRRQERLAWRKPHVRRPYQTLALWKAAHT
jgi:hypothetical protein